MSPCLAYYQHDLAWQGGDVWLNLTVTKDDGRQHAVVQYEGRTSSQFGLHDRVTGTLSPSALFASGRVWLIYCDYWPLERKVLEYLRWHGRELEKVDESEGTVLLLEMPQ